MSDYKEHKQEDFTIWTKAGKIINAWVDNGGIAFPTEVFLTNSVEDGFALMTAHKYYCSTCYKMLEFEGIKFSHFAGIYCEKCAKEYKERNKRVCTLCGKPMHTCYC